MLMLITPDQWLAFDQWFNFQLPAICLIFGGIFLFVGIIPLLYTRNKITWSLFISLLVLCLAVASVCTLKSSSKQVGQYFAQSRYITAQVRSYEMQLFFKKVYDPFEIAQFRYNVDIEDISHLRSIYRKKPVSIPIEYLGRDDYYVYVRLDKKVMKFSTSDTERISGNQAYFSGYKFELRDKGFKKAGFFELPYNMRDKVLIPNDQWDKKVAQTYTENFDHPGLVANWIPDSSK